MTTHRRCTTQPWRAGGGYFKAIEALAYSGSAARQVPFWCAPHPSAMGGFGGAAPRNVRTVQTAAPRSRRRGPRRTRAAADSNTTPGDNEMTQVAEMSSRPAAPAVISAAALSTSIKVEPLTCAIGAELGNVNLGVASRDPGLVAEIRALLLKHRVLFFRDQDITRAEHVAFARHFGELEDHPVAGSDPEHPGLVRIYKNPDSPNDRYENSWHTDATWREKPPFGCVLRCIECPPVGGDTMWANMVLAYERLPGTIKAQIAGLRARHSIEASFGAAMPIDKRLALKAQFPDAEHPVVRTHPETGEKILFVNAFTTHFTNYHTPEFVRVGQDYTHGASDLLRYLISQAFIPEFQVRFRWKPNSMAMWDNRSTQHYAVMDYPPCHRRMERAGIIGDKPF
jgi:taurine dioxygenase